MPNETCTIFYSWQSQLPNATNRGFIEKALEVSARAVREDATIDARPEVDQDTANVPGSPNIADVIRQKIDAAEVVICDVTIVQGLDGDGERVRPTPNPNVLIELGYAMKSLGTTERLVLVMNTAYGGIDKLPFDLRQYRPTTYHLPEGATNDEKAAQRKALASKLEATFRHVLKSPRRPLSAPGTPGLEVLQGTLRLYEVSVPDARWALDLRVYVTPRTRETVYIPFHTVKASIRLPQREVELTDVRLGGVAVDGGESNIGSTVSELVVRGPGLVQLTGAARTEKNLVGHRVELAYSASFSSTDDLPMLLAGKLLHVEPSRDAQGQQTVVWKVEGHRKLNDLFG